MTGPAKLEASSLHCGEKAIDLTLPERPSIICSAALQALLTVGGLRSQVGIFLLNLFLMILVFDAKTIAEAYNCNDAILSISRFFRRKCFASFKKNPSMEEASLDLIRLANVKNVIKAALLQEGSVNYRSF